MLGGAQKPILIHPRSAESTRAAEKQIPIGGNTIPTLFEHIHWNTLLIVLVAVLASPSSSPGAEPVVPSPGGLVAHWKFDEASGIQAGDSSGHGLHGALVNGPQRITSILGSALQLNGATQFVSIPHSVQLKPVREITISAWVLPAQLGSARVIYRKEDGDQRHLFAFHENGTLLAFGLNLQGRYRELSAPVPAQRLLDERWHLATATYDGTAKRVYWDGAEIGVEPASGPIPTEGAAPAYIGSFAGRWEFFDGCIDDVRIYDRALSVGEVRQLYDEAASQVEIAVAAARARLEAAEARRDAVWYPEAVRALRTFQPEVQARWALEGFMTKAPRRLNGKEGYFRTVFDCALLPTVKRNHAQWDIGDCTARAILSWTGLREATGDLTTGGEVERGQREYLLANLNPDTGLIYYQADAARKEYHYQIWDQSRTLRALVRWYETQPQDRARLQPLIERMVCGLERFATLRGTDPVWGPWVAWPSDEFTNDKPGPALAPQIDNLRDGLAIEPLVKYAALTGDNNSLELALRYASCVMGGHAGDNVPPERRRVFQIAPDGSFIAHLHCKTTTLIGLVELARFLAGQNRLAEAKPYLRLARASYDWILSPDNAGRGSRIGWIPERPGRDIHETCCVADVMQLAEALASCDTLAPEFRDWVNLHDDVEAMVVNVVARSQIHYTPKFENRLAEFYRRKGANVSEQLAAGRVFDGLMPAVIYHNDLIWSSGGGSAVWPASDGGSLICGGCCMYAGAIALYTGWNDAMTFANGQLRIHYFLNRRSSQAAMTTQQPLSGQAEIVLQEPAEVLIRVPAWLQPAQLSFMVDGQPRKVVSQVDPSSHFLNLGILPVKTKIEVRFPLEERVEHERIAGRRYRILWRGNYVVQLGPREANIPFLSVNAD
jgi:hypothetical protein